MNFHIYTVFVRMHVRSLDSSKHFISEDRKYRIESFILFYGCRRLIVVKCRLMMMWMMWMMWDGQRPSISVQSDTSWLEEAESKI